MVCAFPFRGLLVPLASSLFQPHLPVAYLHAAEIAALQEPSLDPNWAQVTHQGHCQHGTSTTRSTHMELFFPRRPGQADTLLSTDHRHTVTGLPKGRES